MDGGGGGGRAGTGVANVDVRRNQTIFLVPYRRRQRQQQPKLANNDDNHNHSDQHHNATAAISPDAASLETARLQIPLKRKSISSVPILSQTAVNATNYTANAFIGGRNNRAWRPWMDLQNQQRLDIIPNIQARPRTQSQTQSRTSRPIPIPIQTPVPNAISIPRPSPQSRATSLPNTRNSSVLPIASPSTTQHVVQSSVPPQLVLPTQRDSQQRVPSQQQQTHHRAQQELSALRHQQTQLQLHTITQAHQQAQEALRIFQHHQQEVLRLQQLQDLQKQQQQEGLRLAREQLDRAVQSRALQQYEAHHSNHVNHILRMTSLQSNTQMQSPVQGNPSLHAQTLPTQTQYRTPTQGINLSQPVVPSQNTQHIRSQPMSGPQMRAIPLPNRSHPHTPIGPGPRPAASEDGSRPTNDLVRRSMDKPMFSLILTETGSSVPGHKVIMDHHLLPAALIPSQKVPEGEALFMAMKEVAYLDMNVKPNIFHSCKFETTDETKIAGSRSVVPQPGKPLRIRIVEEESLTYRIRFVAVPKTLTNPDMSSWSCIETKLPQCPFAEINGQILDFRKKKNWGKDLPTDITDYIQQGMNEVKVAFFEDQTEREASKESIAFCIEVLEVTSRTTVHRNCATKQFISIDDSKLRIKERIKPKQSNDDDEIVTVGSDTMILDIRCPISKTILKVPVRGRHCTHIECFDLNSFLSSRPKYLGGVAVTDAWFCPICGPISDCRPQNLVMDGFIKETVRRLIADRGEQHDVDRVIVRSDGMWRVYRPELETKQIQGKKIPEVIELLDDD